MSLLGEVLQMFQPKAAPVNSVEAVERLLAFAEGQYRTARPSIPEGELQLFVAAGLRSVAEMHPEDAEALLPEFLLVLNVIAVDFAVMAPAEYFETLYVIVKHAHFAQGCRIRAGKRAIDVNFLKIGDRAGAVN